MRDEGLWGTSKGVKEWGNSNSNVKYSTHAYKTVDRWKQQIMLPALKFLDNNRFKIEEWTIYTLFVPTIAEDYSK